MKYSYKGGKFNKGDKLKIKITKRANIHLMNQSNFDKFRDGKRYGYYGGVAVYSPYTMTIPNDGYWYVVVKPVAKMAGTLDFSMSVE